MRAYPAAGTYEHYKGGRYRLLFVAEHHETRALQAVYICLKTGSVNVRPLDLAGEDSWFDLVEVDGDRRLRFQWVGS